jgi:chloramphenicol 3-O phosphotransferase
MRQARGVRTNVIVINGGSSSGKSTIARQLQELLAEPWVTLSVDDLVAALSPSLVGDRAPRPGRAPLLRLESDGTVVVEAGWRPVESAWYEGLASMARAGLGVILDEVLLDGGTGQQRVAAAFDGLSLLWVGVRCDPAVAAAREAARGDRIAGMAAAQAVAVHDGMRYDVVVDTTTATAEDCARAISARVA